MKIAIASDHGGFELKENIKKYLEGRNIEVLDLGTNSEESVDYPAFGRACGEAVANGDAERGIVCCGTGIGMSMAANKHRGIRAACCSEVYSAELTRRHNDANVLCFGARVIDTEKALELCHVFLTTEYEGGRHQKRVDLIRATEENVARRV